MSLKLAVAADLHYQKTANWKHPERKGEYAYFFLHRFVKMLMITGWPDAVLIGGDLIDPAGACDHAAFGRLQEIAELLKKIPVPVLVLPGNHDPAPEMFYQVFPQPPDYLEIGNARILPFWADPERPGYNSERLPQELERFDRARRNFSGNLVAFQHVPVLPSGADCPYNYVNHDAVIRKMHETGCVLSVGAHCHRGVPQFSDGKCTYVTVPALCESPFCYAIIELGDDGTVHTEVESFRLPGGFEWFDCHTHTPFAYCSENMDIGIEADLMDQLNLAGAVITEHSGQLYYTNRDFWGHRWFDEGLDSPAVQPRMKLFRQYAAVADSRFRVSFEVDVSRAGEPVLEPEILKSLPFKIGATHYIDQGLSAEESGLQLLSLIEAHGKAGINVLAHPTRILAARGFDEEPWFDRIIAVLKQYNMAAEVNFHQNSANPEFTRRAIEAGLNLSFGTDSHNLANFGFLQPHIWLLRKIGYNGDFADILVKP